MNGIRNGAGTEEEKQKKMKEVMAKLAPVTTVKTSNQPSGSSNAVPAVSVNQAGRGGRRDFTGTITFSPQDGDVRGPLPTALALSRKVNRKGTTHCCDR